MRFLLPRPFLLFSLLLLTFGYFAHPLPGPNVNTRLDLVYAIVEHGTFSIDAYHDEWLTWTCDKALYQGHFYCDKAPGLSFFAVPVYAVLWKAREWIPFWRLLHLKGYPVWVSLTRYLLTVAISGLSAALLGCVLWRIACRLGLSASLAFSLSAGLLVGTVLGGYASLFYAYAPSALCTAGAYWLIFEGRHLGSEAMAGGARLFWAGLLIGLAWLFEYTSGLSGLALCIYALASLKQRALSLWKIALGGIIPVLVFCAYTKSVFNEFTIPYKYEAVEMFRTEMAKGFQGIHLPSLSAIYYLTVHPFRGLFFHSPVLLLALAGVWEGFRRAKREGCVFAPDLFLSLSMILAYFAYSAGYYMWWGGAVTGPRHLCPSIIFYMVPLAIWLKGAGRWRLPLFAGLLAVSVGFNFMILAVDPQVPSKINELNIGAARISDNLPSPLFHDVAPRFCTGYVTLKDGAVRNLLAANLGMFLLGLKGKVSLIPLVLAWGLGAGWLLFRERRKQ